MKIGFDAKRAVQNNTGLGNYSRYLIEILSVYYPDNEYFLYAPKKKNNSRLQTLLSRKNVSFIYPSGLHSLLKSFWRTSGINKYLKKQSLDIFHGLSGELPLGIAKTGIKSIVTIHDLIFLRYPEYYKPIDRFIYKIKFKYACDHADKVVAISECTKRDIISFLGTPEEKITVIYQGCHSNFSIQVGETRKQEVIKKYKLPAKFLLYLGSIESRKNLLLVVEALQHLDQDVHLVAIGKKTPYQDEVEKFAVDNKLTERLHILNGVPFDDLPACYQLASVFVYPSFFEGFGIPILEALNSGVPVIAAKGSCLEEAGGPDSYYIDPNNAVELSEKVNIILENESLKSTMIEKGKLFAQNFSDKIIANQMIELYL